MRAFRTTSGRIEPAVTFPRMKSHIFAGVEFHGSPGQRFAVQLQARRPAGASILHDIPAAGSAAATLVSHVFTDML
jgi:hypothetical protein